MNERKWIGADFWTIVNLRSEIVSRQITELVVQEKNEFAIKVIYAGLLTKQRYVKFNPDKPEIIVEAMLNPNVIHLSLTNGEIANQGFEFEFSITFIPEFTVTNFQVTHEYFTSDERKNRFTFFTKKLIKITNPLYGLIDDIRTSNILLRKAKEPHYGCVTKYAPAIYWGNYFGREHIIKYGREKLMNSPFGIVQEVGEGILITLTQDPMEYNFPLRKREAKKLKGYLGIGNPSFFRRIFK